MASRWRCCLCSITTVIVRDAPVHTEGPIRQHERTHLLDPVGLRGEIRADTIEDVVEVVQRAEEAARRGVWTAGYVSYECVPAFDRGLAVRERDAHWGRQLPLAWFGSIAVAPRRRCGCLQSPDATIKRTGNQ